MRVRARVCHARLKRKERVKLDWHIQVNVEQPELSSSVVLLSASHHS